MFTKAIVRTPAANFSAGLTKAGLGVPIYERALEQHAAYCAALAECGLELTRLEADARYPDSCFVEDAALIIGSPDAGKTAIITRPGALTRQGEVESMRGALAHFFQSIYVIQSPGTLDGGDVCEAGTHFFIGISERTNEAGARQLAEILATQGLTYSLVDISTKDTPASLLHLKSGIAWLGGSTLVVTEPLSDREEFRGHELIQVDDGDEYAANCIEVNGRMLMAAGYPRFERKLRELGYETLSLNMSEFQKMDGGLSCLSLRW